MRTKTVIASAAASLAIGAVGALVFAPTLATAQSEPATDSAPAREVRPGEHRRPEPAGLRDLVDEGVLDQSQAEAVQERLEEAWPSLPHVRGRPLVRLGGLDTAADAIGIDAAELRAAIEGGQSIADAAEANGVDRTTVVGALVDELNTRLDEKVAAGELDREQADAFAAGRSAHLEAIVDGVYERPHLHAPRLPGASRPGS